MKFTIKKIEVSILLALLLAIITANMTAFAGECADIRDNAIRLHILANSDSHEDQALKLQVRDRILAETPELFSQVHSFGDAQGRVAEYLPQLIRTAEDEIRCQGYGYPVSGKLVRMYFDTREYDGRILPAGMYDAVRIEIGAGEGKNWWCVLFPPLCVPAAYDPAEDPDGICADGISGIETLSLQYEPKFAVVELFEKLFHSQE